MRCNAAKRKLHVGRHVRENRDLASAHESMPYRNTSLLVKLGHHSWLQYENKAVLTNFAIHKKKSGLLAPHRLGRDWFKYMKPSIVWKQTIPLVVLHFWHVQDVLS